MAENTDLVRACPLLARGRFWLLSGVAAAFAATLSQPSLAAPPPLSIPVEADDGGPGAPEGAFDFLKNWRRNSGLLGDLWGARRALSDVGISLAIEETSEILGNVTGGSRRGFDYDGLTQAVVQLNTQRAFGWYGGTLNVSALQIHGRNLSADNLQSLETASGIEADRSTRLWELWYDQKFLEDDRADIKIGQQSLDQEFMVSNNALAFVNTMFGWPMLPSADLPGGGPAYPLSAPGVRLRVRPIDALTLLVGLFSGSPVKNAEPDPQIDDASGTSFPLNRGTLAIAELQYSYPALGSMVVQGEVEPLARLYRLGAWYDSEVFDDQRFDRNGVPLADGSAAPRPHRGDYAIYAVADQMIWRSKSDLNRTVSVFGRAMGTPLADRNLIDFSLNAGIVMKDPLPYRTDDTAGFGMGYTHVSSEAAAADRDRAIAMDRFNPSRGSEAYLELTYQYQVTPWLQLQPDLQYVFNPGGGVSDPAKPDSRIKDAFVLGTRTNILF